LLSSASSLYVFAVAPEEADGLVLLVPVLDVPDVPAAPEPAGAVFSTNFVSLDALVLPDVPVLPGVALAALERSMQPVTVTLSAELEDVCDEGDDVCAATPIVTAQTIAAHVPNHTLCFIVSSYCCFSCIRRFVLVQGERHYLRQRGEDRSRSGDCGYSA
jgi:hypothetical protein